MSILKIVKFSALGLIALAQIESSVLSSYAAGTDYPELLVTPRASTRLDIEAKHESEAFWYSTHAAVQASAATTFVSGLLQFSHTDSDKDSSKYGALAGVSVGAGWLALTYVLNRWYKPYSSAQAEISSLSLSKSDRDQLVRERLAEEAINGAASMGRKLTVFSVVSNGAAGVYMISKAQKNSLSALTDAAVIGMALAPVLFPYRWQSIANDQQSYKKKIYAPIASVTLLPDASTQKAVPGLSLAWNF